MNNNKQYFVNVQQIVFCGNLFFAAFPSFPRRSYSSAKSIFDVSQKSFVFICFNDSA